LHYRAILAAERSVGKYTIRQCTAISVPIVLRSAPLQMSSVFGLLALQTQPRKPKADMLEREYVA